jgi:predicted transposase/invertase (TIGR01784 family)
MSGEKFYTLTNDIIFKLIFGHPQRSRLLICLINALLKLEDEKAVTEVQVLNPFNDRDFIGDKQSVLDIKARDGSGLLYNIEMQVSVPEHWAKRILYYAARLYTSQIKESDPYDNLQKTISISILNDVFFPGYESLHNSYRFRNDKNFDALENLIELHFIELPKFNEDKPRALSSRFEKWLHTFRFGDLYSKENSMIPEELQNEEGIKEAIEVMRYANTESEIREKIEAHEKFMRDIISREHSALNKGRKEGIKEGKEEVATNLIKNSSLNDEQISSATGFTLEEIREIRGKA